MKFLRQFAFTTGCLLGCGVVLIVWYATGGWTLTTGLLVAAACGGVVVVVAYRHRVRRALYLALLRKARPEDKDRVTRIYRGRE